MQANLFKDLAHSGWHSSIMTTYSVDAAFYDGSIEYRLRTYGCENNILMADAVMLKRALAATPETFKNAGQRYVIVPVQVSGCFHPKVNLRFGTDRARLIVGSANLTAAGWGRNQEVVTAIDWSQRTDDPTVTATGPLIKKAYDYLTSWLAAVPGDAVDFKLQLHRRDSVWLNGMQANVAPIELADGSAIDLFCERGDGAPSMLAQLAALTAGQRTKRLIVISPYWDIDLSALREIIGMLHECPTIIALNLLENEFPVDALNDEDDIHFSSIHAGEDVQRFLHAKIVLIETDSADHLLFGSSNCSQAALGGLVRGARNAEVSVYRRFPPGQGLDLLGLDLSIKVDRGSIRQSVANTLLFESGQSAVSAGTVEIVERSLTWWPPAHSRPDGAQFVVGEQLFLASAIGNGQFRGHLPFDPTFPLVLRIQFSDGRLSDPLVVNNETALRAASPGVTDRRLRSAFKRVLSGEDDIIDLALQAHLLFASETLQSPQPGYAKGQHDQKSAPSTPANDRTPEEFRQAVERRPANGESGRFSFESPGLLELLAIVLRGVTDLGGRETRKRHDRETDRDLRAGEAEDGDENTEPPSEELESSDEQVALTGAGNIDKRVYTAPQIEKRRNSLLKAVNAFELMMSTLTKKPAAISNRLTAQTAFILDLMLYACTHDHFLPDGQSIRLMKLSPGASGDRELTFAVRAGRLLHRIWVGGPDGAIVDYLNFDTRHLTMSDDMFFLIVMSRWAIVRAYLATTAPTPERIAPFLHEAAIKIYRSTLRFGPLDPEAEQRAVVGLDARLGYSIAETNKLIGIGRQFAAGVTGF
jgi:hypothetical protein